MRKQGISQIWHFLYCQHQPLRAQLLMKIRVTFHSLIVLKFSTVARMYVTTRSGVPRSLIMTVIHGGRVPRITV